MTMEDAKGHIITEVLPGSIAEEMGVECGDMLVSVNGQYPADIFDYRFLMADENVDVVIRDAAGEEYLLCIEKDSDEDFGVSFDLALMDDYHHCVNRCIFCFIDQMPPGMRRTLYFKDDDARLSFLQGNYVTLTNMSTEDVQRIIRYRMEPINVSVHTTDPELRVRMLRNKNAGAALEKLKMLCDAGIHMNGQIVLCRGWNDGEALEKTIRDCASYLPYMQSLSVVPVGLTKYREKCVELKPFDAESASEVIDTIEAWQEKLYPAYSTHFVYASDEWYILAGRPLPEEERYDGYPQLENGVGMIRNFLREAEDALAGYRDVKAQPLRVLLATGKLAAPYIRQTAEKVSAAHPEVHADILAVRNDFFGPLITVAGLVTAQDLIAQIPGDAKEKYDAVFIPCEMLRADEDVFLDDRTVEEAAAEAGIPILVTPQGGGGLVGALLGIPSERTRRQMYEQTDRSGRGTSQRRKIDSF